MRILSIAALVLLLTACKGKDEKAKAPVTETTTTTTPATTTETTTPGETTALNGKWTLVDLDGKEVNPENKKELIGKVSMEFSGNNYTAVSPNDNDNGTFTYDATTHQLVTTSTDGTVEKVTAVVDGSKMTVSNEDGKMMFERAQ